MTGRDHNLISLEEARGRQAPVALAKRSDDELMLLARGGRKEAFEVLVRRYQKRALNVAYKRLGDAASAKDVTQNTFVALYRTLPRYKPQGRLRSLLFRILYNECNKVFRTRAYVDATTEELGHLPGEPFELPDEQILRRERRREVERALLKLSDKLREVVLLRFSADLSYMEISVELGIPLGTVKSRIAAGMNKMRELLKGGE